MNKFKTLLLFTTILSLTTVLVYAEIKKDTTKGEEAGFTEIGYVTGSGRAPAIIIVWEEKSDNTKGKLLISERTIQRDESIKVETERGRIIYDYKYGSNDTWKTDNHAWCHRGEATKIP